MHLCTQGFSGIRDSRVGVWSMTWAAGCGALLSRFGTRPPSRSPSFGTTLEVDRQQENMRAYTPDLARPWWNGTNLKRNHTNESCQVVYHASRILAVFLFYCSKMRYPTRSLYPKCHGTFSWFVFPNSTDRTVDGWKICCSTVFQPLDVLGYFWIT